MPQKPLNSLLTALSPRLPLLAFPCKPCALQGRVSRCLFRKGVQ
ncbi:hypothetical protein JMJ77_0003324 [Colletotrichum scovillei]|uniref:Uncharacterized protein n=1 Tax=Colletotrichum scovillei TaxID=1209932 RepID=A0A9P7QX40_9PEZI|nr:hypothetical protein JMJ78_0006540 [Colletotrichum scovillei]KAG7043621.1 hypothetical protein JMJ77_0003324 [Colletotrichum scovillei]KAG7063073.1 hypothetical protein JMJ76_0009912 [Colletotrichum scovillei]